MAKKVQKNLYLPDWLIDMLSREGDRYDGPGVVAAASIAMFCRLSDAEKMKALKNYRELEIEHAYVNSDLRDVDEAVYKDEKNSSLKNSG